MGRMVGLLAFMSSVVVLTGCSSPAGDHAHPHTVAPAVAAPTPTPTVPAEPGWPYSIGCADILTEAQVQANVTATVSVKADETAVPSRFTDVSLADAGGLRCVWGGADMTDSSYDAGVALTILPKASAAYAARPATTPYPCKAWGCWEDFLVGDTWVEMRYSDSGQKNNATDVQAQVDRVKAIIADRLNSLGVPRAPWSVPEGSLTAGQACLSSGSGLVAGAIGVDPSTVRLDTQPSYSLQYSSVDARSGDTYCRWMIGSGHSSSMTLEVIPGGSWAFAGVSARLLAGPTESGTFTPAVIPGADSAVVACSDYCSAVVSAQHSLAMFTTESPKDQATFIAEVQRLVASLAD